MFAVVGDCTRECLGLVADTSLSGLRVALELDRIIEERGKPKMIVSDKWQRVHQQRDPAMDGLDQGGIALHRTG
ncbi:UNVERIFIED_ORG: transposase InsO family protein [Rhizobium etli]